MRNVLLIVVGAALGSAVTFLMLKDRYDHALNHATLAALDVQVEVRLVEAGERETVVDVDALPKYRVERFQSPGKWNLRDTNGTLKTLIIPFHKPGTGHSKEAFDKITGVLESYDGVRVLTEMNLPDHFVKDGNVIYGYPYLSWGDLKESLSITMSEETIERIVLDHEAYGDLMEKMRDEEIIVPSTTGSLTL